MSKHIHDLPARRVKRVQHHLNLAAVYLDDGAARSARCHIIAALRVTQGLPVPRGPKFWTLEHFAAHR